MHVFLTVSTPSTTTPDAARGGRVRGSMDDGMPLPFFDVQRGCWVCFVSLGVQKEMGFTWRSDN